MKIYNLKYFKPVEELRMEEIEDFYGTSLRQHRKGKLIIMTAPLLVCMALHEKIADILYLLKKFPLLHIGGWTPELEEQESIQKKSVFYEIADSAETLEGEIESKESVKIPDIVAYLGMQKTDYTKEFFELLENQTE